ncbi:MAG: hypothetical protein U1F66_07525 [bacterium]
MLRAELSARAGRSDAVTPSWLPKGMGTAAQRELQSILRERDPGLLGESLSSFAARLEQGGQYEAAAQLYARLAEAPGQEAASGAQVAEPFSPFENIPDEFRRRARTRLDALVGRGGFGPRAELLMRSFAGQASDPRVILPMTLATAAFSMARGLSLARFLGSTEAAWWSRGFGAKAVSGLLGFGVEVPTFVLSSRVLGGGTSSLEKDLLGGAFTLGALKLFGMAGQGVARRVATLAENPTWTSGLSGMSGFLGLLAAHRLEEWAGLRERVEGQALFADTLAAWLALSVGARLGDHLLGHRGRAFQAELALRAEPVLPAAATAGREFAEALALSPATAGEAYFPSPRPAPLWMASSAVERLLRWFQGRLGPSRALAEHPSGQLSAAEKRETMQVVLRRFPQLRKALARSGWTLEEKWELLKAATPRGDRDPREVLQHLPKALAAMAEAGWSYPDQVDLLRSLGELGEFPVPILKHLAPALAAMRGRTWNSEQKLRLMLSLAHRAGREADHVYANLPLALRAMQERLWDFEQQSDFLNMLCSCADAKAGTVMSHLPAAFSFLSEHEWSYAQQSRFLLQLASSAPDPLQVSWMMEEHLPLALGMMAEYRWSPDQQSRFLTQMLASAGPQSPAAMEHLPGLLQTIRGHGWGSEYAHAFLAEIAANSREESGKILQMMPLLLQTMRNRGWSLPTQRELLVELSERASGVTRLSLANFAMQLVQRRLNVPPS